MQSSFRDRVEVARSSRPAGLRIAFLVGLMPSLATMSIMAGGQPALGQSAWTQEVGPAAEDAGGARATTSRRAVRKVKQVTAEPRKAVAAAPVTTPQAPMPAAAPAAMVASAAIPLTICVIDRGFIIQRADINVATSKRLTELRQQASDELLSTQQALQADIKALADEKRPAGDEVLKSKTAALEARARALNTEAELKRRRIDLTREIVNKQISTAALPFLQAAEKQKACTLLLSQESVIDGSGASDITPTVMAAMNASLRPMAFSLVELKPVAPAQPLPSVK